MNILDSKTVRAVSGGYQPEITINERGEIEIKTCTDPR